MWLFDGFLTARQISIDVCTTIEQVYGEFIYKAAGKLLIVAISGVNGSSLQVETVTFEDLEQ